jgi:transcription initiation factor TFIID subunit TAF12
MRLLSQPVQQLQQQQQQQQQQQKRDSRQSVAGGQPKIESSYMWVQSPS